MPHLYCAYNPYFEYYGPDIYKLGIADVLENRMSTYNTGALDPTAVLYSKEVCNDKEAENILFEILKNYRVRLNREFFKTDLQTIKNAINLASDVINNRYSVSIKSSHLNFFNIPIVDQSTYYRLKSLKYTNLLEKLTVDKYEYYNTESQSICKNHIDINLINNLFIYTL